jgi:P27 family predicted phage terminase small subunit
MARPRKTNLEKQMKGTLQKCRVKSGISFEPLCAIPPVPVNLQEDAVGFFKHCCEVLMSNDLLTAADVFEIEQAAFVYGEMRKAQRKVNEEGAVQVCSSGYTQKNANWQIIKDSFTMLSGFYNKYGFNVVSRENIEMPQHPGDDDLSELKK